MKSAIRYAIVGALALATTACATAPTTPPPTNINGNSNQAPLITGTRPTFNTSPMDPAIQCFAQATRQTPTPLRVAVGQIRDYTGKFSNEASEGGFRITQGGSLMVMSALGKLEGIDLIERFDMEIASNEASLVRGQLIQDQIVDPNTGAPSSLRNLTAGQYYGTDYYIVGGITEVNYAIRTGGAQVGISLFEAGRRYYVMNVAADLRLVDTRTLRVVKTVPIQKQIVGTETTAGVFRFFGDYLIDINAGTKDQEPLQLGVRAALEYGTMELLSPLFGNYFTECEPVVDGSFT